MAKNDPTAETVTNSIFTNLASMSFVLFMITIWPQIGQEVVNVHWAWFIGFSALFLFLAFIKKIRK